MCGQVGLAYTNSYNRHARRGTWLHPARGPWHELDGFLVKRGERAGLTRNLRTVEERVLSDHKPKMMEVRIATRRLRAQGG